MQTEVLPGVAAHTSDRYTVSRWCNSLWKRWWDVCGAILLLVVLAPIMVCVALAVKLTSRGPILFRQRRPGKNRREFAILKFRTMVDGRAQAGPVLTKAEDPRVTPFGKYLRKWKLDELPQLLNVLSGNMSFVGPRPQPTKLWTEPSIQNESSYVLSVKPGITSYATLNFRNEEELLAPLASEELENVYLKTIMPLKLRMELDYLSHASFGGDFAIILRTAFRIFHRKAHENDALVKDHLPAKEQKKFRAAAGSAD
ncbi:MAG TPA: sugar transferase [Candidatus Bathyarchaeia archaeon]|nr:sugar transferase [Candidatus Bathyarchaeia archaeon]